MNDSLSVSHLKSISKIDMYKLMMYIKILINSISHNCSFTADFILQEENAPAIFEALVILRGWNPHWKPPFFISDYSTKEIKAIEACNYLPC